MIPDDVECFFPVDNEGQDKYNKLVEVWITPDEQREQFLGETTFSENDYFGNEACVTSFYIKAALVVNIPCFAERTGKPSREF